MKNPFKKILNMSEKDPVSPEQEVEETATEQETPVQNNAEPDKMQELQKQLEEARNKYLYPTTPITNIATATNR